MNKWIRILGYCGACIAFYIGAGFATMQEIMQYEASYGIGLWIVIGVAALIYLYTNISFATNGARAKLQRGGDIYRLYCGKYIGTFFDYFAAFFCYTSFIVMCGGANSVVREQWGLLNGVGSVLLTITVMLTTLFGLEGVIKALKHLGLVIIIMIIGVAAYSLFTNYVNVDVGLETINMGKYEISQVGNGNPFVSGASYGGFVILWFATFLGEMGARYNVKEVNQGMILSLFAIFGVAALCCYALIANIDTVWNVGVPALVLAKGIHPTVAVIYALIIFVGIYTSACPLLWSGVRKVADEGTKRYKFITIVAGLVGCLVACFVPYRGLLNILYGLNGYLGFILVAFMIVNDIRVMIGNRRFDIRE